MATKKKKRESVPDEFRKSAHRIWLAGLGALSAAEEEGSKLFHMLVDRGAQYEAKGKSKAKEAKAKASGTWEKIEAGFDEKVSAALKRVGVPSRREVEDLIERVDRLTRAVEDRTAKKTKKKTSRASKKKTG